MKVQYKPKRNLLGTIFQVEILQGMALTLRKMFSPPITTQYPQEMPPMYPGYRGQHALVRDVATNDTKCIGCMRCSTVCPSRCIHIEYHEDENGKRYVDEYSIEALRCVFCAYCVEVCPVGAITMTEVFEYSNYNRDAIYFNKGALLENWDKFIEGTGYDETYVNPFWCPRGVKSSSLPAAQRKNVPTDWTIAGQFVGTKVGQKRVPEEVARMEESNV